MSDKLTDVKSKEKFVDVKFSGDSNRDSTVPDNLGQLRIEFLMNQIDGSIKQYDRKHRWNAKLAFLIKIMALTLSAIVTILLGLKLQPAAVYNSIALVLSACTGVVAGISAFLDFHELAIKYKETVDKLQLLKVKLNYFNLGENPRDEDKVDYYKNEYLGVLKNTYEYFQSVRKDQGDQTNTDN